MVSITIRDKRLADEQGSPYLVLISSGATAYSAYETVEEFMQEWHDTLAEMNMNSHPFVGQRALGLTADWTVQTVYEYSNGINTCIEAGARPCELLSNGTKAPGAILVDAANRTTTFFRLNPNDPKHKELS